MYSCTFGDFFTTTSTDLSVIFAGQSWVAGTNIGLRGHEARPSRDDTGDGSATKPCHPSARQQTALRPAAGSEDPRKLKRLQQENSPTDQLDKRLQAMMKMYCMKIFKVCVFCCQPCLCFRLGDPKVISTPR